MRNPFQEEGGTWGSMATAVTVPINQLNRDSKFMARKVPFAAEVCRLS